MNIYSVLGADKEDLKYAVISLVAVCAFFTFVFKLSGLFFFVALLILFIAPTFVIVGASGLSLWEKVILGAFVGFGLLPSVVYYVGLLVGSLRIGVLLYLVMCVLVAVFFRKRIFGQPNKV
jgi:hypothetical protein